MLHGRNFFLTHLVIISLFVGAFLVAEAMEQGRTVTGPIRGPDGDWYRESQQVLYDCPNLIEGIEVDDVLANMDCQDAFGVDNLPTNGIAYEDGDRPWLPEQWFDLDFDQQDLQVRTIGGVKAHYLVVSYWQFDPPFISWNVVPTMTDNNGNVFEPDIFNDGQNRTIYFKMTDTTTETIEGDWHLTLFNPYPWDSYL